MRKNIALLAGGYSGEYDISVQSAATIAAQLEADKYRIYTILIRADKWCYIDGKGKEIDIDKNDFSLTVDEERIYFEAVFLAIHGTPGEDGRLQGYFDMLQIPYTGCGAITSALTFNKGYCNKVVAALGLVKVARALHLFSDHTYTTEDICTRLRLPIFVKPAGGGSSLGMSKVSEEEALPEALQLAFEADDQVLIEEYIKGRELTCGIYKSDNQVVALPVTEIKSTKAFFDYEAKYTPGLAEEITPALLPTSITKKIQNVAEALYLDLHCKGIVRFDFILEDATGELYFLEVNTMPGQSSGSVVPKQIKAAGLDAGIVYEAVIQECLDTVSQ